MKPFQKNWRCRIYSQRLTKPFIKSSFGICLFLSTNSFRGYRVLALPLYLLWITVKEDVCWNNPRTMNELKNNINKYDNDITPLLIQCIFTNTHKYFYAGQGVKNGHLELSFL